MYERKNRFFRPFNLKLYLKLVIKTYLIKIEKKYLKFTQLYLSGFLFLNQHAMKHKPDSIVTPMCR